MHPEILFQMNKFLKFNQSLEQPDLEIASDIESIRRKLIHKGNNPDRPTKYEREIIDHMVDHLIYNDFEIAQYFTSISAKKKLARILIALRLIHVIDLLKNDEIEPGTTEYTNTHLVQKKLLYFAQGNARRISATKQQDLANKLITRYTKES